MEKPFLRRWRAEGNHFNGHMPRSSGVIERPCSAVATGASAFHRLLERGAHVDKQVLANHAQEIEAGRASGLFKIGACSPAKFQHAQVGVNSHPARTQAPEQGPVAGLCARLAEFAGRACCRIASVLGRSRAH